MREAAAVPLREIRHFFRRKAHRRRWDAPGRQNEPVIDGFLVAIL